MTFYKNTKAMFRLPDWETLIFFLHYHRSFARRYISIPIYNLPRLRSTTVNRSSERKWFHTHAPTEREREGGGGEMEEPVWDSLEKNQITVKPAHFFFINAVG